MRIKNVTSSSTLSLASTWEALFEKYRDVYLASRNFRQNTRREYLTDIHHLLYFLCTAGIKDAQALSLGNLNEYLALLDRQGLSGSSRRRKASSFKSFFGFLYQLGLMQTNVAAQIIPPKKESKSPRVLSEAEYQRLQLSVANEPRDAAIIELLLQTGIRLSELVSLVVKDIELPTKISQDQENVGVLYVRNGKGGKGRVLALNFKACRAIKNWLKVRPDYGIPALFPSKFRRPITAGGFQWLIQQYFKRADIENAHIHSLRHSFATAHVRKGTNLRVVQEMLGHADLKTTSIYVSLARELMNKEVQQNAL
jgi:site-specific recombinase XerD